MFQPPSLPVRERGLKPADNAQDLVLDGSLPVRERGLKRLYRCKLMRPTWSLPVRERGLKRYAPGTDTRY